MYLWIRSRKVCLFSGNILQRKILNSHPWMQLLLAHEQFPLIPIKRKLQSHSARMCSKLRFIFLLCHPAIIFIPGVSMNYSRAVYVHQVMPKGVHCGFGNISLFSAKSSRNEINRWEKSLFRIKKMSLWAKVPQTIRKFHKQSPHISHDLMHFVHTNRFKLCKK